MTNQLTSPFEVCVDRLPPGQRYSSIYQGDRKTRAAALRNKLWERGRTLSITFLDGDRAVHAKVEPKSGQSMPISALPSVATPTPKSAFPFHNQVPGL
jgi:hypothetical protein